MKTFGTILGKDYTIQDYYASSPFSWTLQSSSLGTLITTPSSDELKGAVNITVANGDESLYNYKAEPYLNPETGVYENVLYSSINHLFYRDGKFYDEYSHITSSLWDITEKFYVVSVGKDFYGERIKPGSFELEIDSISETVLDDKYGNLFVSQSGTGSYVGNIFYSNGIAVIAENTSSVTSTVGSDGIRIVNGSQINLDYYSDVKITRHEIDVKVDASEFNLAFLNPSLRNEIEITGEVTQSLIENNIPSSSLNGWKAQGLMLGGIIKPYITTIGLYDNDYELMAVAKLSTPIQRTFDTDQIFIVRFEV